MDDNVQSIFREAEIVEKKQIQIFIVFFKHSAYGHLPSTAKDVQLLNIPRGQYPSSSENI